MDYQYENLGVERFQEFCHSIVNKEFPNAQAFPVGQPDGGRDSVAFSMSSTKKEFIVFQVKFVRNPKKIQDVHKWLIDTISKEVNKINKLIPKGAAGYYLLTNVNGTAHLDVGSIDKLNKILEDSISIPSMCWWRDDLSGKINSDPMFKWSFPEILNGQDILNSALFQNLNKYKERRENVIQSYLADQYDLDNQVKFRQIDLQNFLMDLFTDVPIRVKKFNEKDKLLERTLSSLENTHRKRIGMSEEYFLFDEPDNIGAAEFLLNPIVQNKIDRILLEGGPGQGKSTISQFICQVHRVKLLEKKNDLQLIPENLKYTPVRIPFKIDLRHIASWVEKKNPYPESLSDVYFKSTWDNSLEAFLVGHIFYHSKNRDFTSNDLVAIFKLSQILLVFDGFDEIANITVRNEVVEFINKGLNRLSQNCKSIQVLITSRPAAFSDAVGFPVEQYPHFELTDITPKIIKEYVEKWVKASGLNNRETAEIKKLVEEKIELPHLRDLAKSPMQLAIFISLLRTKGEALPNKRTSLYDSYINLFFDRESEKSIVIRDNRDLIFDIHQFLAWILHSESEMHKTSGIIQVDDLKKRLNEYLEKEEYNTGITDIFVAVEERVCALVSRVQGTYEFEVQPLREYFCAMYLYKTAPHSPPGSEKAGTKPDRFEAVTRNFYWQNVLRFFAGCFDKGELPMITQELNGLLDEQLIKFTNYPFILTSQLLSDYVFTQSPRNQKNAINIIINGLKSGSLVYQDRRRSNDERISLPAGCGGNEVGHECFNQLKNFPKNDYAYELIMLIMDNPYNKEKHWQDHVFKLDGQQLTKWFKYGEQLQILDKLDEKIIEKIINPQGEDFTERLQILLNGNRFDILDKNLKLKEDALARILNSEIYTYHRSINVSLHFLTLILHPFLLALTIKNTDFNSSYLDFLTRRFDYHPYDSKTVVISKFQVNDGIDKKIEKFLVLIEAALKEDISNWRKNIEPWNTVVESGRKIFGEHWALSIVATISAGIKTKQDFKDFDELNDNRISLCKRVRFARRKSGNIKYWNTQLQQPECSDLTLLVFFTWATPRTICKLLSTVSSKIDLLPQNSFLRLVQAISKTSGISSFTKSEQKIIENGIRENNVSANLIYLLGSRIGNERRGKFIYEFITDYSQIPENALNLKLEYLTNKFYNKPTDNGVLSEIKDCYTKIGNVDLRDYILERNRARVEKLPLVTSQIILKDCKSYPRKIVLVAEMSCKLEANKRLKPVGVIAEEDKWFN